MVDEFNPDAFLAEQAESIPQSVSAIPQTTPIELASDPTFGQSDLTAGNMSTGFDPDAFLADVQSEKYGTTEQQLMSFGEGLGEGIAGPLFTGAQRLANVNPEDILGRREENPVTRGIGQATGLGATLLLGTGLGGAAAKAGTSVVEVANLAKAEGILGKVAAEAIDQATQMAIIQGSDEISKMMINDPTTSAESAIANVGLAAALGGVTGAAIGSISPLWKASGISEKTSKFAQEFKDEMRFLHENPNPIATATTELESLVGNTQQLKQSLYNNGVKGDLIKQALPEFNEANTLKLKAQIDDILANLDDTIAKVEANSKTSTSTKYLQQDRIEFLEKIKSGEGYSNAYDAINDLKKTMQGYASKGGAYGANIEASEFGKVAAQIGSSLKPMLEDSKVWGKAANVQKEFNKAYADFTASKAEKDFLKTFTNEVAGERVINPGKINTFVNQAGKPQAEIKNEILQNYIKEHEKFANRVNSVMAEMGHEPLVEPISMGMLSKLMGEQTSGAKFAQALARKIGDQTAGRVAGATIGGGAGGAVGHPVMGAIMGEYALTPAFTSIMGGMTRKIMDSIAAGSALKSSIDYGMAAAKAQKVFDVGMKNIFKPGAQVLATHLIPDDKQRQKLDKTVTELQNNPDKLTKLDNGRLAHYMPEHQQALSQATTQAVSYLAQLKPQPFRSSPLDTEIPPSPAQMQRYNRALDIAQQPGIVMDHIKNGTVQASDIQDLSHLYPALYAKMSQQLTNAMTEHIAKNEPIPYNTKMGISIFLAQPMDSSMNPINIQATQATFANKTGGTNPQQPMQNRKGTSTLGKKTIQQTQTPLQGAERDKASRD